VFLFFFFSFFLSFFSCFSYFVFCRIYSFSLDSFFGLSSLPSMMVGDDIAEIDMPNSVAPAKLNMHLERKGDIIAR
jgi:hypothetical protein